MDGSASGSHPSMRRHNNKRNFSTMSASHRENSSDDSLFLPRDDHYNNEHAARRRRFELPHRRHHPGDGLDFRRPVMSSAPGGADHGNEHSTRDNAAVIDLTDEDGAQQQLQGTERQDMSTTAPTRSTRAHRLPRFGRDVIEVESSVEDEEDSDISNLPGANYLALPYRRPRPQYSGLRRPPRPPSPPTDMEDVEFLEERPRSRPRHESQQPSPAPRSRFTQRRSATPYPTGLSETIDLTEENDDDIVHLNTRQREGANNDRPGATAGVGTRSLADHGFERMGHIANLFREGGANLGGRLMQRLQGMAGLDGEIRAQQQAYDHFHHNHNRHHVHPAVVRRRQHHHHHHHHRHRPANAANRAPQAIRILQDMPGMMDYNITGFDMGMGGGNRPPTPKYSPPPAADKGFTRGPEEDEVVVCPNCGDELAMGDSDIKQEVWVVKSCGHAYCGECAQNRTRSQNKKSKGKAPAFDDSALPPPFKKCVVEGCGKPASKNSMIHVYLGC